MRPILVQIPSKALFFMALAVAVALFVRDVLRRRQSPATKLTLNPLLLVAAALALVKFRSPTASFIPEVGTFSQPWQPVPIYAYGVMLGTSMIVGWFLVMRNARQDGIPSDQGGIIYMWTAVWSIVGARLLYVITNPSAFIADPVEIVRVNNGGLVAYGGMIGGFLASWYNCHKRRIPLLQWADVAAPAVVLGTGITRMGCFLFGCDFGQRTSLPWAVTFPGPGHFPRSESGSPAWLRHVHHYGLSDQAARSFPVHPTQLYELLVGFGLFGLLMFLRRKRKFSGQVFLGWVIGYGILRPIIEALRDDDQRGTIGPLSTSQFIGMTSVVLGSVLLVYLVRRYRRDPESLRLWEHPILSPAPAGGPSSGGAAGGGAGARAKRKKRR